MVAETPGAASVSPYPCSTRSPVRAVNAAAISGASGAAPEITVSTWAAICAHRSSSSVRASTEGATGRLVTDSAASTSKKSSNPSTSTRVAPAYAALPSTAFRPKTWKSGSMARATVSAVTVPRPLIWSRWANSARWLSMAALDSPDVPAV